MYRLAELSSYLGNPPTFTSITSLESIASVFLGEFMVLYVKHSEAAQY